MMTLEQRFGNPQFVIASLIEKAKNVKSPDVNKPESIVEYGTAVDALVTNITAFKLTDYLNNIQLLSELVDKLPAVLRREWYRWASVNQVKENLEAFQSWLMDEVGTAVRSVKPERQHEEEKKPERGKRHHGFNAAREEEESTCLCCHKSNHKIEACFQFKKMNYDDRWKLVRELKLCFRCLKMGHVSSSCPNSMVCGLDQCEKNHHRLLHRHLRKQQPQHPKDSDSTADMDGNAAGATINAAGAGGIALPLMYVKVTGPAGTKKVLALLDMGCSFTALEQEVAAELGLKGSKTDFSFKVFRGREEREKACSTVQLDISGVHRNSQHYQIKDVKCITKLGIPGNPLDFEDLKKKHPYLRKAKASSIEKGVPQMVIGWDNYRLYFSRFAVEGDKEEDPSAHRSRLGWYVCIGRSSDYSFFACDACASENDKLLHQEIKDFFAVENSGVKSITPARSKEDLRAVELLEKYTRKLDKRWETCLLWREDNLVLPESKAMALKRLQVMERKMDKTAEFSTFVQEKFQDYIEKGYLIPAEHHKATLEPAPRKWFLPWFFAYHPTKKPRLVYDAAARSNGKCLNDFLLKGPDLLNSLPAVLMRFRESKIALTGDIKEMFHQVKLRQEDWPSQTILYRGADRNTEPREYYMTVLFFGAASSPCSAIYAKNKNADIFRDQYPEAVAAIHDNFYMDDFLKSTANENDAIRLREEVTEIHKSGGFEIVKWNSNSRRVRESIPQELRAVDDVQLSAKGADYLDKTLGMWWSPTDDQFQFKVNLDKIPQAVLKKERHPTKREVTSVVMSLFDPLGFLSPVKVKALIIIQNIWKSGISWDDEITPVLNDEWNSWLAELSAVKKVKIPRRMTKGNYDCADMHVFVDGSEAAYSSALYLRFSADGKHEQCFVSGKARVAPIKGLTIPRMELEAALIGARLASTVYNVLNNTLKIKRVTFWSDSKTVLCWLRSTSGRFKMYVQARVGEIQEHSNVADWKWVPTKLNVADDATRSKSSESFSSDCRWLTGVGFLLQDESQWPNENKEETAAVDEEIMEIRQVAFSAVEQDGKFLLPDIGRFSSWIRLIRATAAIYLAKRKFMNLSPKFITVDDMMEAQYQWIAKVQAESFPEEIFALGNEKDLKKTSRLRSLSLELDQQGLIVLRGRIDAAVGAGVPSKRPFILDPKHQYTRMWIQWLHETSGHQGQGRVISVIRQTAWVLDCRNAVRRAWAVCPICKLRKQKPCYPEMGQLPVCRLGESKQLFFHTGVDLFGPLHVKVNRGIQKRWGIIFTCMSTRAVHFDLVESLETSEFLHALSRFIAVRGPPRHIWSDNGTNFVGANKDMKNMLIEWNADEIRRSLAIKGIDWHFNPPAAPHMGGSWERLIGTAKRIIMTLQKSQAPRESILRTLLMQAMDIMNSRPLTYASTDPDDAECITPNHLLKMRNVDGPAVPGIFEESDKYRRAWRYTQHLADEFWKRWTAEYLPTLLKREKWIKPSKPLQEGDVVFLIDDLFPRAAWKKGIIVGTFPGKDGQVRVVDVRVALGKVAGKDKPTFTILQRPTTKVIPLGLNRFVTGSNWEGGNVHASSPREEMNGLEGGQGDWEKGAK